VSKRGISTWFTRHLLNPLVKPTIRLGLVRGWSILETTGRKSGESRQTPVGNGLDGDRFWIVAEHGRKAGYVRNIEADPRVRVFVGRRWRTGRATLLPEDDPLERQRSMPKLNARMVRLAGSELLTVRIDLDPV
jgi:deazaflavin-dependent oxidoreductase (nitroreductase family)